MLHNIDILHTVQIDSSALSVVSSLCTRLLANREFIYFTSLYTQHDDGSVSHRIIVEKSSSGVKSV